MTEVIEQRTVQDIYSLTPMQEGILFHYLEDQTSKGYYEQRTFKLAGVIDKDILQASFQQLVDRYDVFRTNFVYKKTKRPRQIVFESREVRINYLDLSALPEAEKREAETAAKAAIWQKGFDLTKDLLVRIHLIQLAEAAYTLILEFHHITMDGWSGSIMFTDLLHIYQALCHGISPQLPSVAPYSRYIKWLEQQRPRQARAYWRQLLKGYEQAASLPTFKRIRSTTPYQQAELTFTLGANLSDSLRHAAAQKSVTLNTMIQAGWGILLGAYNNTDDVVFGAVISGRPPEIEGVERMVGLFINTVPIRLQLNPEAEVDELLGAVHAQTSDSSAHGYITLADIQAEHPLKNKLFDHILAFESYPLTKELEDLQVQQALGFMVEGTESFEQTNYHFNIAINPADDITITFNFNEAVFETSYLEVIKRQLCHLLAQLASPGSRPLHMLTVLDADSQECLLKMFNPTLQSYPHEHCFPELFQEQVLKTPQNLALLYHDQSLSYEQLNQKANQLAHVLRRQGITPDEPVAIITERSLEMIIAILAVWKAGGAYLPIDPAYPYARREYLIHAAAVHTILIQQDLIPENEDILQQATNTVNLNDPGLYQGEASNLPNLAQANNLAYILFTSGTTGNPKGVMIEHRSVVNLITAQKQTFKVTPDERILQFSSFCFDASVEQIGLALLSGAALVLVDKTTLMDMVKFEALVTQTGITHIHAVPAFLETMTLRHRLKLKRVIAGGDTCPLALTLNWYQEVDFYNEYGPTETTVTSAMYKVETLNGDETSLPIGKPLANTHVYILDHRQQLTSIGVPGRLYIGGAGVARGYLNQPDLTASVFVDDPFRAGQRMYDTGDYARWLPDGTLEFLGRKDTQVKVRGFRIEIEEIEEALRTIPDVKQAAAALKQDFDNNPVLCAYYIADKPLAERVLRVELAEKLPDYMLPTYFLKIEAIPLNQNGKIDRTQLPQPKPSVQEEITLPGTELEQKLHALWCEILNLPADEVGTNSNFVALGGHSLIAIFLISRIHKEFEVEISITDFFKEATIKGLAEYIEHADNKEFISIKPADPRPYYPLSSAQNGMFVLQQLEASGVVYNTPALVWLIGDVELGRLEEAFRKLIMRHDSLRTSFVLFNGEPIQIIRDSAPLFSIEYHECDEAGVREIVRGFMRPFDLSIAPILHVGLIKVAPQKHLLMVEMHHIVTDAVSMDLMVSDLIHLYGYETLPELRLQYKDYAVWQQSEAYQTSLARQRAFWLNELAGDLPVLDLPLDFPRPRFQSFEGDTIKFTVGPDETSILKQLADHTNSTLYVVLVAVLNVFLSKITRQEEILIGTPVAGRRHADLQQIVGVFINTLVLRNFPTPDLSFMSFLEEVKTRTFNAFDSQDFAFEELVETIYTKRDLSRNALFDVMFELETIDPHRVAIPGVKLEPFAIEETVAKFDLTFACFEEDSRLNFDLEYCTQLFKPQTARCLVKYFITLIQNITANPGAALAELQILPTDEATAILSTIGKNPIHPRYETIPQAFEAQAAQYPEKPALVAYGQRLTYRQLNQRANQIAHQLQQVGVIPDTPVGLMLDYSAELIYSLWGILKAGGAYVPIDPAVPLERRNQIIQESNLVFMVTHAPYLQGIGQDVILIDACGETVANQPTDNPITRLTGEHLAYIIYTSGSSGIPKGVMVQHNSFLHSFSGWDEAFHFTTIRPNVLGTYDFTFDTFSGNMCRALLSGGKFVLHSPHILQNFTELHDIIVEEQISILDFSSSYIVPFMKHVYNHQLDMSSLKLLFCGGEALHYDDYITLQTRFGQQMRVINAYGLTEASVDSTYFEEKTPQASRYQLTPIGIGYTNADLYILNHKQLVPDGIKGELFIGGPTVTRGYLNRPRYTAERFIDSPFKPGERLFATGDIVRRHESGNLEFFGRADEQSKIRGFRVEPGDIETHMMTYPDVHIAAVSTKADKDGVLTLCGYYSADVTIDKKALKDYLAERLPSYMVPTYLMQVESFPLKRSGKIDKQALPPPEEALLDLDRTFIAPRTPTEARLVTIWADVLELESIGVTENFFDLGGQSLLAIRLAAAIREAFQIDLPLRFIFDYLTVAEQAGQLASAYGSSTNLQDLPLTPVDRAHRLPLSFSQQRLWFLHQLEPDQAAYNIFSALFLYGPLNRDLFARALTELTARHEVLRTTFAMHEGEAYQHIDSVHQAPLIIIELDEAQQNEATIRQVAREESLRPFDLAMGPLWRVTLLPMGGEKHLLLLTIHHIIADGWSMNILVRDLINLYDDHLRRQPAHLPELVIQYADFAYWQRQWLQGEMLEKQLAYWREQLAGVPTILALPLDFPRPRIQTWHGASYEFTLPDEIVPALRTLAQATESTLFMVLLAAFQTLLFRYSGQTDIVVGSPIANRPRQELENLIGFFINTLALRSDLSGNPTFHELLKQVRATALAAYAHQDLPFERLISELQIERNLSHTPLFQVMFALQDGQGGQIELPNLTVEPYTIPRETAQFDLTLEIAEEPHRLSAVFFYNDALFTEATIRSMAAHLNQLLSAIAINPEQRLTALPLLSAGERLRLLEAGQHLDHTYVRPDCLHQLFEAQVTRTPDRIALVFEETALTYQELNARANQLAHYLRQRGVGPEVFVGLYMERSVEMAVGLLGILKAGGAYVPLDPMYPSERVAYILQDAQTPIVLTVHSLATSLQAQAAELICLDSAWETIGQQAAANPNCNTLAENSLYAIYTSGSTGKPKGTVLTHRNVTRLMAATEARFQFNEQDVWTWFHSCAFDFSVWEMWGAWLYGGRLVMVPYWLSRSPEQFYEFLADQQVTVLNQTPSAFKQLIRATQAAATPRDLSLRWVIFGGEALDLQSLRPWYEQHGDQRPRLVNMYGITETTVHVTFRPLSWTDLEQAPGSMIGQALSDLYVYVLDDRLQLVPHGVVGELYVSGEGLARGYLGRAGLTAERFIPHPFSQVPGTRLYKTGDMGRYLSTGDLEYRGRKDQQVKIRGFRIELGEISAALNQHPQISESLVITYKTDKSAEAQFANDELSLVAYVVTTDENRPTVVELRDFLNRSLPGYMVPALFVFIEAMPLTPHGKIDHRALPQPDAAAVDLGTPFAPPRTVAEKTLAAIWANVLNLERVSIHDNFFDLGGDSIRSVQVLAQARDNGLMLSLQELFQKPTISALAHDLAAADESAISPKQSPFALISEADRQQLPEDIEDAYPLSRLQMGMLFHSDFQPGAAIYHNVATVQLKLPWDETAMRVAIANLATRHPILRTSFDIINYSQPLQLVHKTVDVPLDIYDWRDKCEVDRKAALHNWFEAEIHRAFDWTQAPLLRFYAHRLTDEITQLGWAEHHAILDGWSVASLTTELFQEYLYHLGQGSDPGLIAPTTTFADFIALEQEALHSPEARHYWRQKLAEANRVRLPRWPADPTTQANPPAFYAGSVPLPAALYAGLRRLSQEAQVPIKSVLLAAHVRVMAALTGQINALTGVVTHGRPETLDGERVLGLFLNTLPFYQRVAASSWVDLAQQVFATERELIPVRRYPLAEIQQLHGGEPLFETAFNYTDFHVYQQIQTADVPMLEANGYAETNFTLMASFDVEWGIDNLVLNLSANAAELTRSQFEAIGDYYLCTLKAMVANPQQKPLDSPWFSPQERQKLVVDWNATSAGLPNQTSLHELFEQQVEKTPNAVALRLEGQTLTYAELNQRANQVAWYLRDLGVGPEVVVGLCVERSWEMVIGLWGILKAGGAYLPLDISYPRERLALMVQDAGAALLLTQTHLRPHLPDDDSQVICLDEPGQFSVYGETNLPSWTRPYHLAYLLYTSGSTGKPKAVMIEHRGLPNLLQVVIDHLTIQPDDVVLQFAALGFDASVSEIFGTLLSGATLVLARQEALLPGQPLAQLLHEQQITILPFLTPSALSVLPPGDYPYLRALCVGGEVCPVPLARQWKENKQFINGYGPTENTVYTTHFVNPDDGDILPIGRPIQNVQTYILDSQLHPVPVGVVGELYTGGLQVMRGYWKRPRLTAECLIPNPFARVQDAGSRLYRTGDLARWLPNGQIEFLGRADSQVKIRGFRVELGEIEVVLERHPAVKQAVVLAHTHHDGNKQLVGYAVPHADQTLTAAHLYAFLQEQLPPYMVPPVYMLLEAFPVTANGKVNRRHLPHPDQSRDLLTGEFVAPRSDVEELLAVLWRDVLAVEVVGIYDDFFALGGHSLLATQLISRVRNTFKINLPIQTIFTTPTIAEFAGVLTTYETQPGQIAKIAKALKKLANMTDEEVKVLLKQRQAPRG